MALTTSLWGIKTTRCPLARLCYFLGCNCWWIHLHRWHAYSGIISPPASIPRMFGKYRFCTNNASIKWYSCGCNGITLLSKHYYCHPVGWSICQCYQQCPWGTDFPSEFSMGNVYPIISGSRGHDSNIIFPILLLENDNSRHNDMHSMAIVYITNNPSMIA